MSNPSQKLPSPYHQPNTVTPSNIPTMGFLTHTTIKLKRAIAAVQSGEAMRALSTVCKRAIFQTKKFLRSLDWQQLLRNAWDGVKALLRAIWRWIKAHPYLAAFIVVCVVAIVVPAVVYAPALGAAGFAAAGPVAGSVAAGAQAATGPIAAGSVFAVLQSAAMGGYGVAAVAAGTQAMAVVGIVLALAWSYFDGRQ